VTIDLRFPKRIKKVHVGFNGELDREYPFESKHSGVSIPLKDFGDYSQIDRRLSQDARFNVKCGEATLTLIRISADPTITSFTCEPENIFTGEQATLSWSTRHADGGRVTIDPGVGSVALSGSCKIAPVETTTYTLRLESSGTEELTKTVTVTVRSSPQHRGKPIARVIRQGDGGWRRGKGFSRTEIATAGLTVVDAKRWSLPIDKRRRSTQSTNIKTIRRLIDV